MTSSPQLVLDFDAPAPDRRALPVNAYVRVACPACGARVGEPCRTRIYDLWETVHGVRGGCAHALDEIEEVAFGGERPSMWKGHDVHRRWLAGGTTERCFPGLRAGMKSAGEPVSEAA